MQLVDLEPIIVRRIAGEFRRRGMDADHVFGGLGFDHADLLEPAFLVSGAQTCQVVRRAMALLQDGQLGLKLGATVNPTSWGDCLLGLMASADSREMLGFITEYFPSTGRLLRLRCDDTPQGTWLVATPLSDDDAFNTFLVEKTFAGLVQVCNRLVDSSYGPVQVELALPRPDAEAPHRAFIGCPVSFAAPEHRMLFARTPVTISSRDTVVLERVRRRLRAEGRAAALTSDLESMVTYLFRGRLDRPPTPLEMATSMNISERSLRRRLDEIGLSYRSILDRERRLRALALLRARQLSLEEVALTVGFNDLRTLRRAVKRWSGRSPSEIQREG